MARCLFISYDGPSHDYLEALFVPVLGATSHDVTILEMCPAGSTAAIEDRFRNGKVEVRTVVYRGSSSGLISAGNALTSALLPTVRLVRALRPEIVHTRSYIPALLGLGLKMIRPSSRLVVDLDGWMPQDRVDAGSWSQDGRMYKLFATIERLALRYGDAVVCKTQRDAKRLSRLLGPSMEAKVDVVPNGADPRIFRPLGPSERAAVRAELAVPLGGLLLVHSGSFGELYAPEAVFSLFNLVLDRRPEAWLLVATHDVEAAAAAVSRLPPRTQDRVRVTRLSHSEMPRVLSAADVGLALRSEAPSLSAVSPIKVAEYLCSGLPVLTNSAVGDLAAMFDGHDTAGLVLASLAPECLREGADWVAHVSGDQAEVRRQDARRFGEAEFSLARAAAGYERIYAKVLGRNDDS